MNALINHLRTAYTIFCVCMLRADHARGCCNEIGIDYVVDINAVPVSRPVSPPPLTAATTTMGKSSADNDHKDFEVRDASSLSLPAGHHDAPESVAESGEGKLKMIVSLIKKCLGVKDIATM